MKKILTIMLLCLSLAVTAQTEPKYLAGAVTTHEGRVTFNTEIQTPSLSREQLYATMLEWANARFRPDGKLNPRVLYTNEAEGTIAAGGEEYIVFNSSALSLDRTRIYYQLLITCQTGKCALEMTRIRYWYDEARDGGERYSAEEWITDDMALNKSRTKLAPICGKFRRETINLKDALFESARTALGNKVLGGTTAAQVSPQQAPAAQAVQVNPQAAQAAAETLMRPVAAEPQQPATVAPAADPTQGADRITITAGNDEQIEIGRECWGGFGQLFGKQVAFCLIDTQKTLANLLLAQSDTYTLSFYRHGQAAPIATVKCRKLSTQTLKGSEARNMNSSCVDTKTYNMYVGEVSQP